MYLKMSYQISDFDHLVINWSSIDSHLIDMLTPALNPNTGLILYNCNSLTEADAEILENLFQLLDGVYIKYIGKKFSGLRLIYFLGDYSGGINLFIFASNKFEIGDFGDLSLILRLINSFSWLINKNMVVIRIWNVTFQVFQLFSIAIENMNYFIQLINWKIKLPQDKHKSYYLSQFDYFTNWKFEGESMQIWYRQILKTLGENKYSAIYRLKNFIIWRKNLNEINMLDDFWIKLNKRNLIYNLLLLEIMALIKDIEKLNFYILKYENNYHII